MQVATVSLLALACVHGLREQSRPAVLRVRGGAAASLEAVEARAAEARVKLSSWWDAKPSGATRGSDPDFKTALGLMKARGLANVEKAVALLRAVHERDGSLEARVSFYL